MASPRELRGLVPVELAIVLGAAIAPLPIPAVVPLLVVASLSLWVRGRGLGDRLHAPALGAIVGAGAGGVGLGLGLLLGTPLVEAVTGQAVQWSMYPIVRGNASAFAMVAILVGVSALARRSAGRERGSSLGSRCESTFSHAPNYYTKIRAS